MNNPSINKTWSKGEYPFDRLPCGYCITAHAIFNCNIIEHNELKEEVILLDTIYRNTKHSASFHEANFEELVQLRVKYKNLY